MQFYKSLPIIVIWDYCTSSFQQDDGDWWITDKYKQMAQVLLM